MGMISGRVRRDHRLVLRLSPPPGGAPLTAARFGPDPLDALLPARLARAAALARPAARLVAAVIASADQPLSAQEIAEALGRHHTTVRAQLAALERAGVIEGATDPPRGRGRPLRRYTRAPDPAEREAVGHRELVRLLMGLVRQTGLGPEEMERFGETQGRSVPERGGGVGELGRSCEWGSRRSPWRVPEFNEVSEE